MSLDATLTLDEAAGRCWDAIVVGAGPAGALAARQLALAGVDVLLVDRAPFPRWKVCGCCLSVAALETLRSVGLGGLVERCGGVPLARVCLGVAGRSALLQLPGGRSLSREVFDAALVESAVSAGVSFLPLTQARAPLTPNPFSPRGEGRKKVPSPLGGEGRVRGVALRRLLLRQRDRETNATTRLLLAADGLNGSVLSREPGCEPVVRPGSRIGAAAMAESVPSFFAEGTIYMACGEGGYVGLVRLEDGRLDVAAALDPWLIRRHGGLAGSVAAILGGIGWPVVPRLAELSWRGTPALTRRPSCLAGPRFFVLGDAAGYVEPFTGEGIAWALASAVALAPLAVEAVRDWRPELARDWQALHRRVFGPRRRLCSAVTRVLRWPRLVRLLVGMLAWTPFLAAPLVRRLHS
ncbi:MAG TPA: FAD-dependent monooxygenase [Gemmataceae bacterium]|nr:FAD-dependent monooxygenase [Gemmataceae bacterium]